MHDLFADWYHAVDREPDPDTVAQHWDAAVTVATNSDARETLEVAAFYLGLPDSGTARDRIQTAAKAQDVTFPMRKNDSLLTVIAAGALVHMMALDDEVADAASLALVCALASGQGPTGPIADVAEVAEQTLHARSLSVRHVGPPTDGKVTRLPRFNFGLKDTKDLPATLAAGAWPEGWDKIRVRENELRVAIGKVSGDLNATVDKVEARLGAIERALGSPVIRTLEEETDILWWLFAEHSSDLGIPLRDLANDTRAILVGKEVAGLARFVPGHSSVRAFLDRALGAPPTAGTDAEPELLDLLAVARGLPPEWAVTWVPDAPDVPLGLIPVHAAVAFGHRFGLAEQVAQFSKTTGLPADVAMTPLRLAYQTHNEALLLRLV